MRPSFSWITVLTAVLRVSGLDAYTVPPSSPGYQHGNSTQAVQFDKESLYVDGKRVFLYSGEFHPWRLPVPALWSDILQKLKAAGMNGVSIYTHWGLVEGKRGSVDWGYWRDLELFYQVAQRVGIYVVARPGPYINAETTGGGLPGWLSNLHGTARTDVSDYIAAYQGYISTFSKTTSKYQYPNGPVIAVQSENEFYTSFAGDPTASEYMAQLDMTFRENGIDRVPLIVNDVWPSGHFASGLGEVDIYGFDAYPNGFDCAQPDTWQELPNYFTSNHAANDPWGLMWLVEYQGGAIDGWGGVGYDDCYALTNEQFTNVFYKNNIAAGAKAMNFYMAYGGTNWGNIPEPGVYTSYDYGAAIRESRVLTDKYSEVKLQGLFYQASPSLYGADIVGTTNASGVFITNLAAPNSSTNYYVVAQASNVVKSTTSFKLVANTTQGLITIPQSGQITLAGRESKIFVTEYPFGKSVLTYSTAEVLIQTSIDNYDYILLYVPAGQSMEALVKGSISGSPSVTGSSSIEAIPKNDSVTIFGSPFGVSVVRWGSTVVICMDKATAKTFWNVKTVHTYDLTLRTASVLIAGPYLVRNATVSGSTLNLVGDTNGTTVLTVFAPSAVQSVMWNGATVSTKAGGLGVGITGTLAGSPDELSLPSLKSLLWKSADSLPEISPGFDDSAWVVANKTATARPVQPVGGKYMLYADEYGFHAGSVIYRGYFNGTATGANLTVQGGNFSTWMNGHFLGSGNGLVTFPSGSVTSGQNIMTVLVDSLGLNTDWNADDLFKSPRGIQGYELIGGNDFSLWKLAGTFGGEDYPDKVRGPYNEGGLWAERSGAILPGFNDASWNASTPFVGVSQAGVNIYRTTFNLDVPAGVDASLAFKFTPTLSSNYESLLFVNGWQFGKFRSSVGPQTVFPVPEGILNYHGNNTLAITLWSLDAAGAKVVDLELISLANFKSGKEAVGGIVFSPGAAMLRP